MEKSIAARGYPEEHYRIVAKLYTEAKVYESDLTGGKTEHSVRTARVNNHFAWASYNACENWVRTARVRGFL